MTVAQKPTEISLGELFSACYKGKLTIIIGTLFFAVLSVAISLYLPNQYKSKAILIANSDSSSKLASLAGNLGGLAGMAGINLGSGQDNNNLLIAKELVNSQGFILDFIEKHQLLVPIMAAKEWDPVTNELIIDESMYDTKNKLWLLADNPNSETRPKRENIVKEFREIVSLVEDSKTGIITMSAEFYSPTLAQQWLTWFIDEINEKIRQSDIQESTKSIAYLRELLNETNNSHFRQTFSTLIEEQTKKLMLSQVRDDYVFKLVDAPTLPEKKSKPLRAVICVVITLAGGLVMTLFVLLRYFFKQE